MRGVSGSWARSIMSVYLSYARPRELIPCEKQFRVWSPVNFSIAAIYDRCTLLKYQRLQQRIFDLVVLHEISAIRVDCSRRLC
jgi:hypothetical protein